MISSNTKDPREEEKEEQFTLPPKQKVHSKFSDRTLFIQALNVMKIVHKL